MSTSPSHTSTANPIERFIRGIGQFVLARWAGVLQLIRFFGGAVGLIFDTFSWALRGIYAPEARMGSFGKHSLLRIDLLFLLEPLSPLPPASAGES